MMHGKLFSFLAMFAAMGALCGQARADFLNDQFSTGYGGGAVTGQNGGAGWAADSTWLRRGSDLAEITASGTLRMANQFNETSYRGQSLSRQYEAPNVSHYVYETRVTVTTMDGPFSRMELTTHNTGNLHLTHFNYRNDPIIPNPYLSNEPGGDYMFTIRAVNDDIQIIGWNNNDSAWEDRVEYSTANNDIDFGFIEGHEYIFRVEVLGSDQWRGYVEDVTLGESYTSPVMGFRGAFTAPGQYWYYSTLIDVTAGGEFDIEFDYLTIVPEPASIALMGVGMLLMTRRRRQA